MINRMMDRSRGMKNFRIIEKAVSDFDGVARVNVAGRGDWGCSSLLDFSDGAKTKWTGRDDFVVTQTIAANVTRLDTFIFNEKIEEITFLHIDAQGSDLKILRGLGNYTHIVKAGCVEAATKANILYSGQNTEDETIDFLKAAGFRISHVSPNDPQRNEVNIHFMR
jgi:FkbM family methyltransferase